MSRSLLNNEELTKLQKAVEHNNGILKHHFNVGDGDGRNLGHVMWSHPGNDITGMIAKSEKVGGFMGKVSIDVWHNFVGGGGVFSRIRTCELEKWASNNFTTFF